MPEYLSKEEIRKWRSSLERITLEEYAARLGKVIQDEKDTNDMVDKVMLNSLNSMSTESYPVKTEEIKSITLRSFRKEKEIITSKPAKQVKKEAPAKQAAQPKVEKPAKTQIVNTINTSGDELPISFNKTLTQREQMVFEHFYANKNKIVYAKDLAQILSLPRDYVYKYIKNLRTKMNEDILHNADNGGYLLKI